jgi:hypothetical protein
MAISKLDADGEAWEMRFRATAPGPGSDASRLRRIAAAIREAFNLIGYDGMLDPFVDNWHTDNWPTGTWDAGS